ncbi:MAG: hypothetical protein EOP43_00010 [Sphingobacteriaceae bacterium]|nr:MAG: hypothetical protein EOP43_00010 [Sphingobacteriaceae bacterium]
MKISSFIKVPFYICLFLWIIIVTSCASSKKIRYFQDLSDTAKLTEIKTAPYYSPLIQSDDILTITILTADPTATQSINAANLPVQATGVFVQQSAADQAITGYLVSKNGEVEIPVIGKVKVAGLTSSGAKQVIYDLATRYYKDPVVVVRNKNFRITVLGEVNRPSTYILPNEKVTVLDALGLAGDLTIYGKRDNILLQRQQEDGTLKLIRLNLNSTATLKSPYFFLKQNDVLYIEPSKQKINSSDVTLTRNIGIITSVLTVAVLLIQVLR